MKVIGFVGSPRKGGNTELAMRETLKVCEREGLETEMINLSEKSLKPCQECLYCKKNKVCKIEDDFQEIYKKMLDAEGIILASPVFFSSITSELKALIDRAGYLGIAAGRPFERKVGGALVVGRRAGHNFAFAEILFFFMYHGMIVPGSTYWNVVFGKEVGEVMNDTEGLDTARNLARNMAWLIKKLHS